MAALLDDREEQLYVLRELEREFENWKAKHDMIVTQYEMLDKIAFSETKKRQAIRLEIDGLSFELDRSRRRIDYFRARLVAPLRGMPVLFARWWCSCRGSLFGGCAGPGKRVRCRW